MQHLVLFTTLCLSSCLLSVSLCSSLFLSLLLTLSKYFQGTVFVLKVADWNSSHPVSELEMEQLKMPVFFIITASLTEESLHFVSCLAHRGQQECLLALARMVPDDDRLQWDFSLYSRSKISRKMDVLIKIKLTLKPESILFQNLRNITYI